MYVTREHVYQENCFRGRVSVSVESMSSIEEELATVS